MKMESKQIKREDSIKQCIMGNEQTPGATIMEALNVQLRCLQHLFFKYNYGLTIAYL